MPKPTDEVKRQSEKYARRWWLPQQGRKAKCLCQGSLRVLDDEHVAFADIASPRTVTNIRENPQVAVICLDAATRKGCRIWGQGSILDSGELFDQIAAEYAEKNMQVKNVVKVAVEEVETS